MLSAAVAVLLSVDNCRKRNLLPAAARLVFVRRVRSSYRYVLLTRRRRRSSPVACQPLAPTVCRNLNSSCGSCDDAVHRWLTSGGAINRGAAPVIGADGAAAAAFRPDRCVPLIVERPPCDLPLCPVHTGSSPVPEPARNWVGSGDEKNAAPIQRHRFTIVNCAR